MKLARSFEKDAGRGVVLAAVDGDMLRSPVGTDDANGDPGREGGSRGVCEE